MTKTLFPEQVKGRDWLAELGDKLLADIPGLGKTAQTITALDKIGAEAVLVFVPAVARKNWQREFTQWSPDREVVVIDKLADAPKVFEAKVYILSLNALSVNTKHGKRMRTAIRRRAWDVLVVDEAHALKDAESNRTKRVYGSNIANGGIASRCFKRILLTGTPLLNHPAELWTHLNALWPELITTQYGNVMDYDGFMRHFCLCKLNSMHKVVPTGVKRPKELREVLSKIMLRRTHIEGLPPLLWDSEPYFVDVSTRELKKLERHNDFEDIESVMRSLQDGDNSDEYLYMATIRRLTGLLKADVSADYCETVLYHKDNKCIVFAVHRETIERLTERLGKWQPAVIHGAVPDGKRNDEIDRFNNDPDCQVFIGQITACSTAINLQVANEVVFVEMDWTPAINAQAVARAHRRGQLSAVHVQSLAVEGSIDETIQRVLARKSKTVDEVLI